MKWINVKDKLPEHINDVFICSAQHNPEFNSYTVGYYVQTSGRWGVVTDMLRASNYDGDATIELDEKVTHWKEIIGPKEIGK